MSYPFSYDPHTAVVETTQGRIRGYEYRNLSIFKGVPYAQAKRFHAPEPVTPWEDVLDTTSFGYVCPLLDMPKPNGELLVPHRYWIMDENCQNLNIWTPGCDDKARPVMVWLHGGGFAAGSAIEHIAYEGENMAIYGDVVVVTINHRLNVLGFCDLSAFGEEYANSGNAGMDDIIAALQWIHDNIARFGGDPANVTLFGQSGGGAKITTLLQMPAADGLFAKGINMSGVIGPVLADSKGSGEELVRAMMNELKIDKVRELETVPYAALAAAYVKTTPALGAAGKYTGGSPIPNSYYAGDPLLNGFRKESSQVPLMVGSVFGEFTSFAPSSVDVHTATPEEGCEAVRALLGTELAGKILPLFKKAYPERHPANLMTLDFIFRAPEQHYIRIRSAMNRCTYAYLFNQDMPIDGGRTPWHCADVPFFFHNTELAPYTQMEGGLTTKLENEIFGAAMAFARTGDPNHPGIPQWNPSTPQEEWTILFDDHTRVVCNHDRELIPLMAGEAGPAFRKKFEENRDKVQH